MDKAEIETIVTKAKGSVRLDAVREYKVMNDHCIVIPVVFKDAPSTSGLVNPSQYEDKNEYGVVVASGPGRYTENGVRVEPEFTVGDVILYGPYSYTKLRVHGTDLNLIRHDDVTAVLPN